MDEVLHDSNGIKTINFWDARNRGKPDKIKGGAKQGRSLKQWSIAVMSTMERN